MTDYLRMAGVGWGRNEEHVEGKRHRLGVVEVRACSMRSGWGLVSGASPGHLEDLGHVFRVPLLCDIAQLSRDIDSAADVHVHLHSLFLDLCIQVCHGLQGGQ